MLILESPVIRLHYEPASDILIADLSKRHEYYALEIQEGLNSIVETVRYYDVKRLLMDSRNRVIAIDNEVYAAMMADFIQQLKTTRLQKLARLNTPNAARESLAHKMKQAYMPYTFETFSSREQAMEWLKA